MARLHRPPRPRPNGLRLRIRYRVPSHGPGNLQPRRTLAARRLVLLTGPAEPAAQELSSFLAANIGFEPPAVLHPLPTLVGERRNQLLTAGETIVRRAVIQRQALAGQLHARIVAALASQPSANEAHLGFLLTLRYPAERPIQREAAKRMATSVFIDRHDSTSPALRLRLIAEQLEQRKKIRIISDLFGGQLGPLPSQVPVETWVPPLIGSAFWERIPPLPPQDRVVVHFGHHSQKLQDLGISPAQIDLLPLTPSAGTAASPPNPLQLRHRIALIADLPAHDMKSLGIDLPTHQAVYAAARELILADYLTVHPGMASDLLRRALSRAGVDPKIDDPNLREPMLRVLRDALIPALPLLTLCQHLGPLSAITLIGDWPAIIPPPNTDLRIIPFDCYKTTLWDDVALLAHLSPQGTFSPILWDALAARVPIVTPQHASDRQAGSLVKILKPDAEFFHPSPQNYLSTVKSLLRDAPRREKIATAAADRLAKSQTPS